MFPKPGAGPSAWVVLTCHDLGFGAGSSHRQFWPAAINRLAAAWGRDPRYFSL